tara:strand:+ start:442 stop:711 length:270 start_codon:yes stop_codon:yes gene_type:complete
MIKLNKLYLKKNNIYIYKMLYATCPTCNNLLADKQIYFEEEKEKIENNKKLSKKDKEKNIEKLLDKIFLTRYCCRMRMITYLDQVNIII